MRFLKLKKSKIYIFVSTDDEKLKDIAKQKGLKLFTNDRIYLPQKSNVVDTVIHGLRWFENHNKINVDAILLYNQQVQLEKLMK